MLFKQWDTVFPNASCAVDLIDRAHERWGRIDPKDDRLATSRWDVVALGATAALVVWGVASALLG